MYKPEKYKKEEFRKRQEKHLNMHVIAWAIGPRNDRIDPASNGSINCNFASLFARPVCRAVGNGCVTV